MHAVAWPAVMPRDVAALVAPVQHPRVIRLRMYGREHCIDQRGFAGGAVGGAEVQVGQPALEEARQHRGDRVRVPEHDARMHGAQPREFARQRLVIGPPPAFAAGGDLLARGRHIPPHRLAAEGLGGHQPGRRHARVQARAVGRAVQVDHIARLRRDHDRGAERGDEVVDDRQVPVGVGKRGGLRGEAGGDVRGQAGADVRHRHQQRRIAADPLEGGVGRVAFEGDHRGVLGVGA